ncbi:hypothetical protein NDU88_003512 [Pleurodeles waltl]|uniref:Uncharacterized protein n=1 Tax=Pleurodeles waltl TaxID=8319 RepID=A0AAV7W3S5_PLEWA|nr:hypothetical protein NDU88_003512 [Pleurodeles waltl]
MGSQPHPDHFPFGGGEEGPVGARIAAPVTVSDPPGAGSPQRHNLFAPEGPGTAPTHPYGRRWCSGTFGGGCGRRTAPGLKDLRVMVYSSGVRLHYVLPCTTCSHGFSSSRLPSRPGTGRGPYILHGAAASPQHLGSAAARHPPLWVLRYHPEPLWVPLGRQDA